MSLASFNFVFSYLYRYEPPTVKEAILLCTWFSLVFYLLCKKVSLASFYKLILVQILNNFCDSKEAIFFVMSQSVSCFAFSDCVKINK